MKIKYLIPFLVTIIVFMISCKKDKPVVEETAKFGKIAFQFLHKVNGQPLHVDTLLYTNAAGNQYDINEIQYFVSEVTLHNSNGTSMEINEGNGIHYVDTDLPGTKNWLVTDDIPVGNYSSISFTFGINETKNQTGLFYNAPEVNMWWPEYLGGGYHYMKMNGNWKDTHDTIHPFNFHLGIGQIYDAVVHDSIVGFVQNYFMVTLPNSSFTISDQTTTSAEIIMNIESWFETPNIYDFNYWGGSVMQNEAAMHTITQNGADVFTFQLIP